MKTTFGNKKCSGCKKKISGTMFLNDKGYQCAKCGRENTRKKIEKYIKSKEPKKEVSLDKHKEIAICYLKSWFGLCKPYKGKYEPDCLGCMAARIVKNLKS